MLSCLLLWLRHSSLQLLCPASRFVQSSLLHFITLRSRSIAHVHFVWVMNPNKSSAHNHKLHSLPSQAHSAPFRFIPSSFTQQAAVHPLTLLCSPALSFGLRAVMSFASHDCWPTHLRLLSTTPAPQAKSHASPCSVMPANSAHVPTRSRHCPRSSHRPDRAFLLTPSLHSRSHPAKRGVRPSGSHADSLAPQF